MKKIRVIQFIPTFGVGGAENIARQYSELINRSKFEVKVIALHNVGSYYDEELKRKGVEVVYINDMIDEKIPFVPARFRRIFHFIFRRIILRDEIKKFNPDVFHYHLTCSRIVREANIREDTKIVLTVHSEPAYFWGKGSLWEKDYHDTRMLMEKYDMSLVCLSEDMKRNIDETWFNDIMHRTFILNNGIDVAKYLEKKDKSELSNKLKLSKDSIIIGHVGSFLPVKNHDFLIDIFNHIKKTEEKAVLLLIGDGIEKNLINEKVERLGIADSVKFLGIREDISDLMQVMDIMIFPSLTEGISVTLIEAQVSGLKCLVSNGVPAENEISSNLVTFLPLKVGADKWADEAIHILRMDKDYECNYKDWDINESVRKLEALYEELVD